MSINPNTRTATVEVLMNAAELEGLDRVRQMFGMDRSPFLRFLTNNAVRTHSTTPPPFRESRGCRGPGRPASRARGVSARRNL